MAPGVVLLPEDLAPTVHEIGREKETDLDLLLIKESEIIAPTRS